MLAKERRPWREAAKGGRHPAPRRPPPEHPCGSGARRGPRGRTHVGDEAAGADRVAEAHPLLVVRVVPAPQEVLAARVVGLLVEHPAAAVHADGVAAAEIGLQVGAVAAALVAAALEAPVLVEGDLRWKTRGQPEVSGGSAPNTAGAQQTWHGTSLGWLTFPMVVGSDDQRPV